MYLSADEFLELERARLSLRAHGIGVDRGRLVREAIALLIMDLQMGTDASAVARRLRPPSRPGPDSGAAANGAPDGLPVSGDLADGGLAVGVPAIGGPANGGLAGGLAAGGGAGSGAAFNRALVNGAPGGGVPGNGASADAAADGDWVSGGPASGAAAVPQ